MTGIQNRCGCVADDPLDCIEARHRRWPRESADFFSDNGCACACHDERRPDADIRDHLHMEAR